jgi:putative spermidine/putrescine transport system ATP-binding protein
MSQAIAIRGLAKRYGTRDAIRDLDLDVAAGEFFTLLGASGSGKTTTLMAVAGFVTPDAGDIRIGAQSVLGMPPEKRGLGVVFQSYALFPTMTVAANIAFPLRMRGMGRADIDGRVARALALVNLQQFGDRRVTQLSGGQQQRVAVARAIVFEPPVLLMDEPLGALDRQLREQLQGELRRLQQTLGITVLYVTHDQEEALSLSDRVAIMADARLQQVGAPMAVYERPANLFVARFMGESNILPCQSASDRDGLWQVTLGDGVMRSTGQPAGPVRPATVMLRPESLLLRSDPAGQGVSGVVVDRAFLGGSLRISVRTPLGLLTLRRPRLERGARVEIGEATVVDWDGLEMRLFDAAGNAISRPG